MKKTYLEPKVETVMLSEKEDILLYSDVDMDVSGLYDFSATLN